MKYIEELQNGDCFEYQNKKFLLTADFKKNGSRLAYSLTDGSAHWLESNTIIEICPIYFLDKDNNICPISIKESK